MMSKVRSTPKQQETKVTLDEETLSRLQSRSNSEVQEELLEQGVDQEEELSVTMKKDEA
jgi:hypothetical protein